MSNETNIKDIPEYRIMAVANSALKNQLEREPFTVNPESSVDWQLECSDDGCTLSGDISLPVKIELKLQEDDNLKVWQLSIDGKRLVVPIEREEKFDPLATVDKNSVEGKLRLNYMKNIKS